MSQNLTPEYLQQEYTVNGRSDRDIAQEHDTYANAVRRLRLKHGIPSRNKAEAQELALQKGRHNHPTRGKHRDEKSRQNISEGVADAWERKDEVKRLEHSERAKRQWDKMGEAERDAMRRQAAQAVRETVVNGTKLEQFLLSELSKDNEVVFHHMEGEFQTDLYLPNKKVAIEILGISHFEPIWGEEYLEKRRWIDKEKAEIFLNCGITFIQVKNTVKNLSEKKKRSLLVSIQETLEKGGECRLIELEAK